jgi:endonuclease-3
MATENKVEYILLTLKKTYPDAKISLQFTTSLELFVAVVLSAQCTDKMVNRVSRKLFSKYQTMKDYATANINEFQEIIHPVGLYRSKARNIKKACKIMMEKFDSNVPDTMEDLVQLPGVARKSANVILYHTYKIVGGIAVDTHVGRLSRRLGLTTEKNPDKVEKDLCRIIPRSEWHNINHLFIAHGRAVCKAPIPHCMRCVISGICPSRMRTTKK